METTTIVVQGDLPSGEIAKVRSLAPFAAPRHILDVMLRDALDRMGVDAPGAINLRVLVLIEGQSHV